MAKITVEKADDFLPRFMTWGLTIGLAIENLEGVSIGDIAKVEFDDNPDKRFKKLAQSAAHAMAKRKGWKIKTNWIGDTLAIWRIKKL